MRAWWAEHPAAQRRSGGTQAAYCRAQGLDPKYFTLWKGMLQATAKATSAAVWLAMVCSSFCCVEETRA